MEDIAIFKILRTFKQLIMLKSTGAVFIKIRTNYLKNKVLLEFDFLKGLQSWVS